MNQTIAPSTEAPNPRRWMGWLIIAVILGEGVWNLIVSVVNNLVVPWLGDVMGQSSGLPTSFTQRPYNYPELFVSVIEFCLAGLVAAVLNYFFQPPKTVRVKTSAKSSVAPARIEPAIAQPALVPPAAVPLPSTNPLPVSSRTAEPASSAPRPVEAIRIDAPPPSPVRAEAPAPIPMAAPAAKPAAVVSAAPATAKPPAAAKAEPQKSQKAKKEVYYNIVGEPMPDDE